MQMTIIEQTEPSPPSLSERVKRAKERLLQADPKKVMAAVQQLCKESEETDAEWKKLADDVLSRGLDDESELGRLALATSVLLMSYNEVVNELDDYIKWFPQCRMCGKQVEKQRICYAVPTCYACLPPPPPLKDALPASEVPTQ